MENIDILSSDPSLDPISELYIRKGKLDYLALNFDPYSKAVTKEIGNYLDEFELTQYQNDPFKLTNQILTLLDIVNTQIENVNINTKKDKNE
jgi:hypothetical protein